MSSLLVVLMVVVSIISLIRRLPKSACGGDCNQGRNCSCQPTSKEHPVQWKKP